MAGCEGAGGGVETEHCGGERGEVAHAGFGIDFKVPLHQHEPVLAHVACLDGVEGCEEDDGAVEGIVHACSVFAGSSTLLHEGDEVWDRVDGRVEQVEDVLLADCSHPCGVGELAQYLEVGADLLVVLFHAHWLVWREGEEGGQKVGHGGGLTIFEMAEMAKMEVVGLVALADDHILKAMCTRARGRGSGSIRKASLTFVAHFMRLRQHKSFPKREGVTVIKAMWGQARQQGPMHSNVSWRKCSCVNGGRNQSHH